MVFPRPHHTSLQQADTFFNPVLRRCDQLRGRRGGGCAQVRNEVRNRMVDLMPNRGDHGQPRRRNCPRQGFVVETGEVFKRATPARNQNDVDAKWVARPLTIEEAHAVCHLCGTKRALHDGGIKDQVQPGMATLNHLDDVMDGGS